MRNSAKEIVIRYQGKELRTKIYKAMSYELFQKLKSEFYKKPDLNSVKRELYGIFYRNRVKISNVTSYFFKDLMAQVKLYHSKWSVADVFEHKPLLEHFYGVVFSNEKVYPPDKPLIKNIETAFRIRGKGVAEKPANFKLGVVKEILKKYSMNNNYVDTSCGWGVRMLGSLVMGMNYYGIDPNPILVEKLYQLYELCKEIKHDLPQIDIRCQGSEFYIPEWENKMGIAFTSPPYYNLEDYKFGNQSTKLYKSYHEWLEHFYTRTIENTYRYVISGGYMLINIKNYGNYDLEEQTVRIAERAGFEHIDTITYDNIKRCSPQHGLISNNEKIFVFKKQ